MTASKRSFAFTSVAGVPGERAGERPERFRIIAINPFEIPDLPLIQALSRRGVAAVLDIGRDASAWPELWARLEKMAAGSIGLRIPDHVDINNIKIPDAVGFAVISGLLEEIPACLRELPMLMQVCSLAEAERALALGVDGLIAKGQESSGRVADESAFVLLQRVMALAPACPVWCQGGMGLYTAAGAIAGGAFGVVLDSALAPFPECSLVPEVKAQVLAMDGSEVRALADYQVLPRNVRGTAALEGLDGAAVRALLAEREGPLLALGQDAALAKNLFQECATLETLFSSLRMRMSAQVRQATALNVLAPGNSWAQAHGTRYPVAQGPMTRVSDTAAFCAAVADGGGLPFLALSLMQEDACRTLLDATCKQVGNKPWGVGVLGFAPPEILQPQLDLIQALKPSVVLLAGGRPSQARPLNDLGIPTYLHVPSPGLLELFLKDGATHFVFEGRECGGHVGPRYSFVLWEQAIAILLAAEHPEKLHILFAGGIHDERSSAMVATIAAPLAALGAKIGVLMGTAYIATEEAVSCGAVLEGFQQRALGGGETVLVETAPGHAIRCIPSGFMDLFEREKQRLQADGVEQKEAWKALEALTVGRLRIATKGVEYQQGVLAPVDMARQEAEGMYMIGQVIAMKTQVTTIAALHEQVSQGAQEFLQGVIPLPLQRSPQAEPVAIVGMACIYPGSPDLESYWSHIVEGHDLVREVAPERWSVAQYYQAGEAGPGKTPSKWGGFINDTAFDPLAYGIPPQSLAAIEPVQLLSLEVANQALRDAGYGDRYFDREKTAVIFGAESGMDLASQYTFRNLYPQYCGELPEALDKVLPTLTEDSFPGVLVNVISGRIANRLGLGGVNYSVDAACASSLTAIELAVKELRSGTSDMVLAGGADFHNGISDFLMFSSVGALSASGRCRSFDNSADGICLGEGVGIVVLKRLADAERDGDRIYAVIDGVAGSSDGKGLGLTAPRKEGQKRALERTYWQAGVLPAEVGLVEAHGTGTVVGDRTELKTLTEIYNAGGAVPGAAGLGSVKSQIGHTKCAAGIAGLIKIAKALHHRVLPPTGQIQQPNAWYKAGSSPFVLRAEATPWLDDQARAAVSAFGFGGTNFHAVLSAYPAHNHVHGAVALPGELFLVRGESFDEALKVLRLLGEFLVRSTAGFDLRDVAAAAWQAGSGPVQCAFVAADAVELKQRLAVAQARREGDGVYFRGEEAVGKIACLFSGQGSQYPGMLQDLFVYFPALQPILQAGREYVPFLFPATAYDDAARAQQQQTLTDTCHAQPGLAMVEMAAFQWLSAFGFTPDMSGGHSFGELSALASAGAFDAAALIALARARADAILQAVGEDAGSMAAVSLGSGALAALLADYPRVVMANQNSPVQTVLSGPTADIKAVCEFLRQQSVGCKIIDTACAFHSPLVADAEALFAEVLQRQALGALQWPVYGNELAQPHRGNADALRASLARHIVSPVRFVEQIERMHADGARVFVEIGPRRVLTGLVSKILKQQPHKAIALDHEGRGLIGMLESVAELAVLMPDFQADAFFAGRTRPLDLNVPRLLAPTTWMVNGGRAWPLKGNAPAHAAAVVIEPVVHNGGLPQAPALSMTAEANPLVSYLSNMRDIVNAQRDVLLSYFGQAPAFERPTTRPVLDVMSVSRETAPLVAAVTAAEAAAPTRDFRSVLLGIVSERTGYPADMLDLDLDLEADLSIDSIKRVEIIGELSQQLSIRETIGQDADSLIDQLAAQKTLRAVLSWLSARLPAPVSAESVSMVAKALRVDEVLLEIVSQCTGYPSEALDLDLDLEADLSIDSIKRLEVVSQLTARLGIASNAADKDAMLDSLAALKTLRAMIAWLEQRVAQPEPVAKPLLAASADAVIPLSRYVMRSVDAPPVVRASASLAGKQFVITDDSLGLAPRVADLLRQQGVEVRVINFSESEPIPDNLDQIDGLLHLWSLNPANRVRDVKRFFNVVRDSLLNKTRYLLVASGLGGDFGVNFTARTQADFGQGAGLAGLIKSVVKEFPELRAHWVDLDLTESLDRLAHYIEQELTADNDLTEVAYQAGSRRTREVVPVELAAGSVEGLPLTAESVVLLTGGARGITARIAIALARRYRCRLEMVGRSAEPAGAEGQATQGIIDPRLLRQALMAEDASRKPADIEKLAKQILAEREFRETMEQIQAAGSQVNYTQLDVREIEVFSAFINALYQKQGRIDGVIHGAGVVEDKLVRHKSAESFQRVFDTKVRGALMLNKLIRDDVKFVVFFSSVAGAFGNKGQVDYASANDVLDKLAHAWQTRIDGRVLSVNWGPWADTGMVSESLEKEYARKGIGLIPQAEGVDALLRELSVGRKGDTQVVLMCGTPESFGGKSSASTAKDSVS